MYRPKLALPGVGLCLAVLISGCGSSTSTPPAPLQITSPSALPGARMNSPYNTTLTATGGVPPYSWSASTLPAGLVLSTAGVLSGTPACCVAGNFPFTVAVSDSARPPGGATGNFSITIAAPLQITTTALPNGSVGVFYGPSMVVTGGFTPYTWAITQGSLPPGLTLNATNGLISGSPTNSGTSNFTVQVTDNGSPAATVNANLSILVNPAPGRSAALYISDGTGLMFQSDGSVTLLPSSPESAIPFGSVGFAVSPTLPLIFLLSGYGLEALQVNPDYSLVLYSGPVQLPNGTNCCSPPSVDPTGSNLYLPGAIDSNNTSGVLIYSANGSLQSLGSIATPAVGQYSRMVFTPDGTLAFLGTCPVSGPASILSLSRASSGMLTSAATYPLPAVLCAQGLSVSPDGKYLAEWEFNPANVQVFSIASNGTLSPASQPLTVTFDTQGTPVGLWDMTWDGSGSFLFAGTVETRFSNSYGGIAVLSFSGRTLAETAYPTGPPVQRIQRAGSFVYGKISGCLHALCPGVDGFDFQNGQLVPLPGSPWQSYGTYEYDDMVIY